METQRFDPQHELWEEYVAHLKRTENARWVLDEDQRPLADLLFLGAVADGRVVGNLALRRQVVTCPATEWCGGVPRPLLDADGEPVEEMFVQTFHVQAAHRRLGIGRSLQQAALEWTRIEGCCQMRSWSSLDRPENYRLKLCLGFAMHPEVHRAAAGHDVSGVYFVKRVD